MKRSKARTDTSIDFARSQRRTSNEFATTVWQWIRNRQIHRVKFRREFPIPPYTVDFCCIDLKLIIEIDGEGHFSDEGLAHDRERDRYLSKLGYQILRIPGYAVIREGREVILLIQEFVKRAINCPENPSPPDPRPTLPEAGRGGEELRIEN